MIKQFETEITKDLDNKKLVVTREFNAPVDMVWRAWTEPELLDKWWAPKPYKAITVSMDFREGGLWRYDMKGPEGDRHHCRCDYDTIKVNRSFSGKDGFCDADGNLSNEFPGMYWLTNFNDNEGITLVNVEISFDTIEDLEKIVEMGFKEGFTMAHGNLDELLETLK